MASLVYEVIWVLWIETLGAATALEMFACLNGLIGLSGFGLLDISRLKKTTIGYD
jgi:hypothetical protein